MKAILNIALVAHDSRKNELLDWVRFNADLLSKHHLYATGTTGKLISELEFGTDEGTDYGLLRLCESRNDVISSHHLNSSHHLGTISVALPSTNTSV